jgi:hypothetical protein
MVNAAMRDVVPVAAPYATPRLPGVGSVQYSSIAMLAFVAALGASALGAYNVGPFPIQWLGQAIIVAAAVALAVGCYLYPVPGMGLFAVLFGWMLTVTLLNSAVGDYAARMPPRATTAYPVFLALRFIVLIAFAATVVVVYFLLVRGFEKHVLRWTVRIGVVIALVSLYVYLAEVYGWWEPVRTRLSTGGGEQRMVYAYAFHRAAGTFREPSHLAEWLVVPFFLSFLGPGGGARLATLAMGSALLLTGSLTGIVGVVLGLVAAILMTNPLRGGKLRLLAHVALAITVALFVFSRIAISLREGSANLVGVVIARLGPILLEGGMRESNRGYIYEYAASHGLPVVGAGLGHSNLLLGEALGSTLVTSFISLYINYLYSAGIIGLGLLGLFLVRPLLQVLALPAALRDRHLTVVLAAYLSWLIMFAVHSEEPSVMFGIIVALVVFAIRERGGSATAQT